MFYCSAQVIFRKSTLNSKSTPKGAKEKPFGAFYCHQRVLYEFIVPKRLVRIALKFLEQFHNRHRHGV